MTSTTHQGDILIRRRARRALAAPRLRTRAMAVQGLAALAGLGVLVLLLQGHGVAWLGGLLAGSSVTAGLVSRRPARVAAGPASADSGHQETRTELATLEREDWSAVHDFEARFARYEHVAVGPGGIVALHSARLAHAWSSEDPGSRRERLLLRRRALASAANLRDEIHEATGVPSWVSPVVVVWSDFPAQCVQDGRCVFVSGPRLLDWLRRRPDQLSPQRAADVLAALRAGAAGGHVPPASGS